MTKIRDGQKSKVYEAENVVRQYNPDTKFSTHKDCQKFVDKIVKSSFWKKYVTSYMLHHGKVVIRQRKSCNTATAFRPNIIALPNSEWARDKYVLLHELAHLGLNDWTPRNFSAHGKEFCALYLKFVKRFLGVEEYKKLKTSFLNRNIKHIVRKAKNENH